MSAEPNPRWLLNRRANADAALRLYCFPHTGGTTISEYLAWAQHLPEVDVWGVQLPGRGSRVDEQPLSTVEAIVAAVTREVEFKAPFAFFGHSFGGLLAFEVARALRDSGRPGPCHLYVSGCAAPTLQVHTGLAQHTLDDEAFLNEMERVYGGLPQQIHASPGLVRRIVSSWRADTAAAERYRYRPGEPLPCPITASGGLHDYENEPFLLPWEQETANSFELRMFGGEHFYFRQEPAAWFAFLRESLRADYRSPAM